MRVLEVRMLNKATLELGLTVEVIKYNVPVAELRQVAETIKHKSIDQYHIVEQRVSEWLDEYDKKHPHVEICTNDIMCLAEENHERSCPMTANWKCDCTWCKQGLPFTSILHSNDCTRST